MLQWSGTGADNTSRLFWSDGNTRFAIHGIVFDGNGKAGVGLDHDSHTQYESRYVHRHLAFQNFVVAGLRVGHNQVILPACRSFLVMILPHIV